jgi:glycerophosphoryl diester phosphodiesterase
MVTPEMLADIRRAERACYVWTVNEPAQMDRLVEWGVSGIITDRPGLLRARLGRLSG